MEDRNIALGCLVLYSSWVIFLVLAIGLSRFYLVLKYQMKANEFPSGVPHGPDVYWRLNRAHLNSVENLPIFAALVIVGHLLGKAQTDIFINSCMMILTARIFQSLVHVSSGRSRVVLVRFFFFAVQVIAYLILSAQILFTKL